MITTAKTSSDNSKRKNLSQTQKNISQLTIAISIFQGVMSGRLETLQELRMLSRNTLWLLVTNPQRKIYFVLLWNTFISIFVLWMSCGKKRSIKLNHPKRSHPNVCTSCAFSNHSWSWKNFKLYVHLWRLTQARDVINILTMLFGFMFS